MSSELATRRRKARKAHFCAACDYPESKSEQYWAVQPGDVYLMHTAFRGHDAGYAIDAGHPVQQAECAHCARKYGRGHMLGGAE